MRRRLALALLALTLGSGIFQTAGVSAQTPDEVRAFLTERAEAYGASVGVVLEIAACETGERYTPFLIGSAGERGLAQWLPGRGNAWDQTPLYRAGVDIVSMYRAGHAEAWYADADMLAWAFSPQAPRGFGAHHWVYCSRRVGLR